MSSETKRFAAAGPGQGGRGQTAGGRAVPTVARTAAEGGGGSATDHAAHIASHPSPTAHQQDDIAIRVSNLSKCYQIYDRPEDRLKQSIVPRLQRLMHRPVRNYFREFWALRDVSFEVKKGETVGIVGRNGSGKSTLLQVICGTLAPTSGTVETKGRIAALLELGSGFNPEFTGRENVYMNGAVLGLSKEEIDARFDDIAAFANIGEFMEQPVKTYSSGMVVRLAFSVSVFVDPDVLVVDEALAVGDAAFQLKCLDRLRTLIERGTTLLFVSHDMGMVKNFCGKALYLRGGELRAAGRPDEIAELYFMDIRAEQARARPSSREISAKPPLSDREGMAFGTDEGAIVRAYFASARSTFSSFLPGDTAQVCVEARYRDSVDRPFVSFILQDRRLVDLGGEAFALEGKEIAPGWKADTLLFQFPVRLNAGRYHITLRLENRASRKVFFPIDKQPGALSFEVLDSNKGFLLGAMDLRAERIASGDGRLEGP